MNEYRALAAVYDAFTEDIDFASYAKRYIELLRRSGVEDGIVCDLACGTGSLTQYVCRAGYDVICVDRSADMLAAAAQKFSLCGCAMPLMLCQDMTQLDLYGTAKAFICTIDGLNHLTSAEDLNKAAGRVSLFLEPGGVFIFDLNTVHKHAGTIGSGNFIYEDENAFAARTSSYDGDTHTTKAHMDIFIKEKGGLWRRTDEDVCERAYPDSELLPVLTGAGLTLEAEYDDLTDRAPTGGSDRIIYVTRKVKQK